MVNAWHSKAHTGRCLWCMLTLVCCYAAHYNVTYMYLQPLLAAGAGWTGRDAESGMVVIDRWAAALHLLLQAPGSPCATNCMVMVYWLKWFAA